MGVLDVRLAGAFIATTGLRTSMRNVAHDPARNIGIVEINEQGDAWHRVGPEGWRRAHGGVPAAFAAHAQHRVVYSCVPANVAAAPAAAGRRCPRVTKALWSALPQAMAVVP